MSARIAPAEPPFPAEGAAALLVAAADQGARWGLPGLGEIAASNEAALTALDHVAVAVSRIDTGRGQPAGATEQALQELRRFAERAGLYGRQQ